MRMRRSSHRKLCSSMFHRIPSMPILPFPCIFLRISSEHPTSEDTSPRKRITMKFAHAVAASTLLAACTGCSGAKPAPDEPVSAQSTALPASISVADIALANKFSFRTRAQWAIKRAQKNTTRIFFSSRYSRGACRKVSDRSDASSESVRHTVPPLRCDVFLEAQVLCSHCTRRGT